MNIFLNILFSILGIAAICLIMFLFVKASLVVEFKKKKGEKIKYSANLKLLGGIIKINLLLLKSKKKKKEAQSAKKEDDLKFVEKVKKHYSEFCSLKAAYSKNSRKIRRAIHAEKICFNLSFGLGDAAQTGIATGGVWAGIYSVIAFVSSIIRITEPKINVTPSYNEIICEADGEIVIKTRPVNLLIAVAGFGITYLKIKKNNKNKLKGGD